ncbi:hypothetical protein [Vreelandella venusta]|uniref:hypothetical protein n=1 Tax=Vreelandella venusta TaxID=44935 RepID=UPI001F11DE35|nr:hypothetical protein [Halomonas venusta]
MSRRNTYYDHCETAQKGSLDITPWLLWFLGTLKEALGQVLLRIDRKPPSSSAMPLPC